MNAVLLWALPVAAAALAAQAPGPSFDVGSIKRNAGGPSAPGRMDQRPGGYSAINTPIALLVNFAYPFDGRDIVGAPDWFYEDGYDVEVRYPATATAQERQAMWRAFFAERLQLAAHVESREQPAFALVLARADGRMSDSLKRVAADCATREAARLRGETLPPAPLASNGMAQCATKLGPTGVASGGISMAALARLVQPTTGRVVVDRTGLSGDYELTLTFAPRRPSTSIEAPRPDDIPQIATALQDQLGLKLEPIRAPVNVLVIDRIERPAGN